MEHSVIRLSADSPYHMLAGVGGIGAGMFFELAGDHTLGRNESRPGLLLDVRDYCKLHIIAHYPAVLLGARPGGEPFGVLPIGCVGDDETGRRLCREMAGAGMDVRFVRAVPNTPTLMSVCFQYPDGTGGNITTSNGAAACITTADIDRAEGDLAAHNGRLIALAAPEVPLEIRYYFLQSASRHGAMRVASLASAEVAAAKAMGMIGLVDLLAINEDEAAAFVGAPFNTESPEAFLQALAGALTAMHPGIRILLSAGPAGAFGFADGRWDHCPAATVPIASTAGAGDALLGGVLSAIAAGVPFIQAGFATAEPGCAQAKPGRARNSFTDQPLASALDFGVLVAAMSVTSPHSIHGDARLPSVLDFARRLGATFAGPLAKSVCPPQGLRT